MIHGIQLKQQLFQTYKIAAEDRNRMFGGLVIFFGLVWALGIYLIIQQYFSFQFIDTGIAAWNAEVMSGARYPKQQDTFHYLFAITFLPLFSLLCWGGWLLYNTISARVTGFPVHRLLRWDTLTLLPSLLIFGRLHCPEKTFSKVLLVPFVALVCLKLILFLVVFLRNRDGSRYKAELADSPCANDEITTSGDRVVQGSGIGRVSDPQPSSNPQLEVCSQRRFRVPWFFAPSLRQAHWYPIAAGLCVGIFLLVEYGSPETSPQRGCAILAASSIGLWAFWLGYSKFISVLLRKSEESILLADAPTYLPAILLLAQSFLFVIPHAGRLLFGLAVVLCVIGKLIMLRIVANKDGTARRSPTDHFGRMGSTIYCIARRLLIYMLIPFLIWAALYDSNIHGGIDCFHEGERLGPASDYLRGKIPYRDFYVQHGLFQNVYKTLLAFELFGESISSDRSLSKNPLGSSGFLTPLGFVAAYYLALALYRRKLSAVMAVILLVMVDVWLSERHVLAFLVFFLIALFLDKKKVWMLWIAGVVSTLAVFNSVETGLYAFAASSFFLVIFAVVQQNGSVRERMLMPGRYWLGVFAGSVPFLAYFAAHGALVDLFLVSYTACILQVPVWGLPFPSLLPELSTLVSLDAWKAFLLGTTFKWYLPVLVYVVAIIRVAYLALYRMFENEDWKLVLVLIAAITFFRSALGRSDDVHLIFATPPFWLLCLLLLERPFVSIAPCAYLGNKGRGMLRAGVRTGLTAIFALACCCYIFAAYQPFKTAKRRLHVLTSHGALPGIDDVVLPIARGGCTRIPRQQADSIGRIVEYIQTKTAPDECIFDFTNQPIFYFLANRRNPTRYYFAAYAATEKMQEEVVADLKRERPAYVLAYPSESEPSGFSGGNADDQLIIGKYLCSNYQKEAEIAGVTMLARISH